MIDFELSDDQKQLKNLAHDFAEKEIRPRAAHYDETGEWPEDILKKAFELGLVSIHVPESCGGLGLGALDGSIIEEELAWGCMGITTAVTANSLGQVPVIIAGTEDQKKKWLSPFATEHHICAYA